MRDEASQTLDLNQSASLQELRLSKPVEVDAEYGELNSGAITLLERCSAPASLRTLDVDLDPNAESCNGYRVWMYLGDQSLLEAVSRSITTLKVTGAVFETDEVDTALLGHRRPPALAHLELDVYKRPSSITTLNSVAAQCHALNIRFRLAPYRVVLWELDRREEQEAGYWGEDELESVGIDMLWDGGEWEEPCISDSDEGEASSVEGE